MPLINKNEAAIMRDAVIKAETEMCTFSVLKNRINTPLISMTDQIARNIFS